MSFEDVNFEEVSFEDLDFSHRRTVRIGNSPLLSFHPHLTVYAVSLADGTVITNGLPDDLTKAICEIFIIEQFAGAGGARARRSRHLTDENRHIQERRRQANNKKKNDPLSGHSRPRRCSAATCRTLIKALGSKWFRSMHALRGAI
jgi:hypothetical protein